MEWIVETFENPVIYNIINAIVRSIKSLGEDIEAFHGETKGFGDQITRSVRIRITDQSNSGKAPLREAASAPS
jgi:hypothetical protein